MRRQEEDGRAVEDKGNNDIKQREEEAEMKEVVVVEESEIVVSPSRYESLLAPKYPHFLLSPTGTKVKVSDLESKVIGIYFSANWHSPCRKFMQVLVNVYLQLKLRNAGFEIVFVSSDEDVNAFDTYRACMPWLAIPFSDLETRKALNQRFGIEGIPALIVIQPNHNKDDAVVHNGVELVYRHGMEAFPFTKERLEELQKEEWEKHENQTLKDLLTHPDRDFVLGHSILEQVPVASLTGKTVGLYFSAEWCLPGLKFTPKLIAVYQKIKQELVKKGDAEGFEVVFVSTDHDQMAFDGYFRTMPWLALPFDDPTIKDLTKYFDITGIPGLVILGPDGKTLIKQGRNLINLYQENAYPFTRARVELLEKQMDEEAKALPKSEYHVGHRHELNLVSEGTGGGAFICCDCDEQGYG